MKQTSLLLVLVFILGPWDPAAGFSNPQDRQFQHLRQAAKFRFEMDNDIFFGSDNQFSNGWNFRLHTAAYPTWDSIITAPKWVRTFGDRFPSLKGKGLFYRTGFSVGQVISTPADVSRADLIENDVPYVGVLAAQISWSAYNNDKFRAFGLTFGTIGRSSLAEQSQNVIHKLTGSEIAEGWDNQLSDELALNLNYVRAKKVFSNAYNRKLQWDVSLAMGGSLGNIFTGIETGLEMRFGRNMPKGFGLAPEIIGATVGYDATLPPQKTRENSIYSSLSLTAAYMFHQLFIDGALFSRNYGEWVESRPLIGLSALGFHYETPRWATHLHWIWTTETIDVERLENDEDTRNRFLSVTLEWKI